MTEEGHECRLCGTDVADSLYWDPVCFVVFCNTCQDVPMIVLQRHTAEPTVQEMDHIERIRLREFGHLRFRGEGMRNLHDHWCEHLVA